MLKKITAPGRKTDIFISDAPIGRCVSVVITNGSELAGQLASPLKPHVSEGTTALTGAGVGVTIIGALSGKPCRVVRGGVVSGVYLLANVGAGDALCAANNTSGPGFVSGAGKLTLATITPAGFINVNTPVSGIISGVLTGTAFNPRKVIALALMSGGIGSAIPVMVIGG